MSFFKSRMVKRETDRVGGLVLIWFGMMSAHYFEYLNESCLVASDTAQLPLLISLFYVYNTNWNPNF
jgi:hypothetical protein